MNLLVNGGVFLLSIILFSALEKVLQKFWWNPIRVQRAMASQGVRGPPYGFAHGSTREIFKLREEVARQMNKHTVDVSHDILPIVEPHIYKWSQMFGGIFLYWYGPAALLLISDTELVKEVLNNRDKTYVKPDFPGDIKKLLGDGLFSTKGEKWARQRRLAHLAFHGESLKCMIPAMVDSVHMLLKRWQNLEAREVELFEEFTAITSDVISRTAFGSSYIEGRNMFQMLGELTTIASRNIFKLRLPGVRNIWKTSDEIDSERLEKAIRDVVLEIIRKREEKVNTGEMNDYGNDLLGSLLKAYHDPDESKRITIDDVMDECKTFYFAGQETTNSVLTWTLFLLAIHKDWQQEARKEVTDVFGNEDPNHDGIMKLKTVGMIINESLRLYPPVISLLRKVKKQVTLGNLVLPADIVLDIPTLAIHHDRRIWGNDVHLFKPERFSEGIAKATNNNAAAFLPFGLGPRTCVGINFATNEAKIAIAMILQRYSFTLSPGYIHLPAHILTIHPQHGVKVILHPLQCEHVRAQLD
ncbi:cytochrome P450 CYP749A22 isoform X1 [Eucalyptus grandis]|nr:cytochrome P450 CYP749A22 isoform X1 [Eucalyptus grandis]